MTTTPPLTDAQLREALGTAIHEDALRPAAERVGLVNVMLAIVQPEMTRLRTRVSALEQDSAELSALQAHGVDNWDGYEEALSALR